MVGLIAGGAQFGSHSGGSFEKQTSAQSQSESDNRQGSNQADGAFRKQKRLQPIEKPHKPFTFGSRSIQTIGLRVSEFTGPKQVEEKKRVATHHETSKPWQQATKFTT